MLLARKMKLDEIARAAGGKLSAGRPDLPISGISTDTRAVEPGELFIALRGQRFDGHDFLAEAGRGGAAAVVIEEESAARAPKDLSAARITVPDTLRALGDLARHYRQKFGLSVVAITGSNGKTSTKEILVSILKRAWGEEQVLGSGGNWNNQVGVPLTLFQLRERQRVAVLELGTNQPGEIARLAEIAGPEIGLITNISPAHLEGLKGVEGVAREKEALLLSLSPERGRAVLNFDDPRLRAAGERFQQRGGTVIYFGLDPGAAVRGDRVRGKGWGTDFQAEFSGRSFPARINFPGRAGVKNSLAAGAAAAALGLGPEEIVEAWKEIGPFPQRLKPVLSAGGCWVIDDTYNANPDSVAEALEVLSRQGADSGRAGSRTWAVLGEMLELGEAAEEAHYRIGQRAAGLGIDRLVLLDSADGMIRSLAEGASFSGMGDEAILIFAGQEEMGEALRELLAPGDTALVKGSRSTRMDRVVEVILRDDAV